MKGILKILNSNFISTPLVIFIVLLATFLPTTIFYADIKLDRPLFVTEWLKICFEVLLISLIVHILVIIRDFRLEKTMDTKYLSENILFFLDECLNNLIILEKNVTSENCNKIGKRINLCWCQASLFFESKLYFNLNNKSTSINLFYFHSELIEKGEINHLNDYLKMYTYLDNAKINFIKEILIDIKGNLTTLTQ